MSPDTSCDQHQARASEALAALAGPTASAAAQVLYAHHRQALSEEPEDDPDHDHEAEAEQDPEGGSDDDGETSVYAGLSTDAKRPHMCIYQGCGKTFGRLEHLKRHIRSHTGERPFGCSYPGCNKRFSRYDNMLQHSRCHTKVSQRKKRVNKDLFKPFVAPPPRAPALPIVLPPGSPTAAAAAAAGLQFPGSSSLPSSSSLLHRSVSPTTSRIAKKPAAERRHARKSSLSQKEEDAEEKKPYPLLSKSSNSSLFSHATTEDMDSLDGSFDEDEEDEHEHEEDDDEDEAEDDTGLRLDGASHRSRLHHQQSQQPLSTSLPNMSLPFSSSTTTATTPSASKWHLDVLLSASDALSKMSLPDSSATPSPVLSRPVLPPPATLRSQEVMPAVDVKKLDDYFLQQLQVANTLCSFKKTENTFHTSSSTELLSGKPALLTQ